MGWYPYLLAGALLVVAVLISRSRSRNSLRARNISGNVLVGDVSGTVSQTSGPPPAPEPKPDRVAWAIGIVGVLIAAAALAYDVLAKK
jgi:hypothetical protein